MSEVGTLLFQLRTFYSNTVNAADKELIGTMHISVPYKWIPYKRIHVANQFLGKD